MSNLKTAIIQFLANEFQLDPDQLTPETSFSQDLNLTPAQISDLLQRLQDALNFTLPDDSLAITSIADLFAAIES